MLKDLLESLDKEVFTAELTESVEAQFNEAIKAKEVELQEAFDLKLEESKNALIEEYEVKLSEIKDQLVEQVDLYLDKVVEDFVTESKDLLESSIKSEKADMIIEAFDGMLVASGVTISKIVEAKNEESLDAKLAESIEKYDNLMNEHLELKKEKDEILKEALIMESKEGLSLVEAEKFEKLAKIVQFTSDETYSEKLQTIKESVKGSIKEEKEEKVIVENVNESKISYSHLV